MEVWVIVSPLLGCLGVCTEHRMAVLKLRYEAQKRGYSVQWWDDEQLHCYLDNGLMTETHTATICKIVVDKLFD